MTQESGHDPIRAYKNYSWIVWHPDLLGGKPTIRGTRISVSQVLGLMGKGITAEGLAEDYEGFPQECIPELLRFASEQAAKPVDPSDVAA